MVHAPPHYPAARRRGSADKAMANRRNNNNGGGAPASNRGSSFNQRERQVGQFVLSKTMGEGTFGEVKLAVHKPTSERVAAKVCKDAATAQHARIVIAVEILRSEATFPRNKT